MYKHAPFTKLAFICGRKFKIIFKSYKQYSLSFIVILMIVLKIRLGAKGVSYFYKTILKSAILQILIKKLIKAKNQN